MYELNGIGVSQGIAVGHAVLIDDEVYHIPRVKILKNNIEEEITRFLTSLEATRKELQELQDKVLKTTDSEKADFFNFHLLIVEDPSFIDKISNLIKNNFQNAEWATYDVIDNESKKFLSIEDEYMKERVRDLYDIGKRIIRHLQKKEKRTLKNLQPDSIIVASDLTPAETAMMDLKNIKGFITDAGGKTSHTAILASALGIPAVVGTVYATRTIKDNELIILDSNNGKVIVNPDEKTLKEYKLVFRVWIKFRHELEKLSHLESVTIDGKRIEVLGNIEIPEETDAVLKNGGSGIGLYRTEYYYLNRNILPTEDELKKVFCNVVEKMKPLPVTFRTLDIGGDKFSDSILDVKKDANPFLGWRAIRFCLENIDIFKTQLRAMLHASALGKVKIMLPMISDISEILKTKKIFSEIFEEMKNKKELFDPSVEIGAMIEIPSAALTSDTLASEVDFFSVGSNDLTQYTLAVDRTNPKIANMYDPFHPSVLYLLKTTIDSAKKRKIPVSICGEMASDPVAVPLLVGLGFDELSVSPASIPQVKRVIRSISFEETEKLAKKILSIDSSPTIHTTLIKFVKEKNPDIFYQNSKE